MKRMQIQTHMLTFGAADTSAMGNFDENGWAELIVMKVPTFTNVVTVTKIEYLDHDGDVIYTNSTGWALNATHQITGVNIPIGMSNGSKYYQVRVTLSGAPGGTGGTITVKSFMKANGI